MRRPQRIPLQPVPEWGEAGASILSAHIGNTDYLLGASKRRRPGEPEPQDYRSNEEVWRDLLASRLVHGSTLKLRRFQLMDWFPRSPGLYHTRHARYARDEALNYLHRGLEKTPILNRKGHIAHARKLDDGYTAILTPAGKQSMLEGGIGAIRLKPVEIFGEPHWLMTASSDGVAHSGVPVAVPKRLYAPLLAQIQGKGGVCADVAGELEFVPNAFSGLFDTAVMVPRLLVRATTVEKKAQRAASGLEASVAVSFVSDFEGRPQVYASYVTFHPNVRGSFDEAVSWMKTDYVEGEYRGRIITDFDQTRTVFPEARLALSRVMSRQLSRSDLEQTVELMHARASVDAYFDEITKKELLPRTGHRGRKGIFISYAHAAERDTGWVKRMRIHLQGLRNASGIEVWDDTRIDAGQRWRDEIERAIRRTRVAILVLTPEFLASPFIQEAELPLLLEAADADGATILCISGGEVFLSGWAERLMRYQFVNPPEQALQRLSKTDQESVYASLARRVHEIVAH